MAGRKSPPLSVFLDEKESLSATRPGRGGSHGPQSEFLVELRNEESSDYKRNALKMVACQR